MKRVRIIPILLVLGGTACGIQIQKVPSTSYSKMSEAERERVQYPPDSSFSFREKEYENPDDVELYEIDAERFTALMDSSMNTWVYMWATYCPHCLMDLKKHHQKDSARPDMQLFLVSANYDPPVIRKYVHRSGYRKPVFVIDAERYGKGNSQRMNAFAEAIGPEPLDSMNALPQHFLFEGNEWRAHLSGRISSDTLDHYFD